MIRRGALTVALAMMAGAVSAQGTVPFDANAPFTITAFTADGGRVAVASRGATYLCGLSPAGENLVLQSCRQIQARPAPRTVFGPGQRTQAFQQMLQDARQPARMQDVTLALLRQHGCKFTPNVFRDIGTNYRHVLGYMKGAGMIVPDLNARPIGTGWPAQDVQMLRTAQAMLKQGFEAALQDLQRQRKVSFDGKMYRIVGGC